MNQQTICTRHKEPTLFICTLQLCQYRLLCQNCKLKDVPHFAQHVNYIYKLKDFKQFTSSKDTITRLEKGISDAETQLLQHKMHYQQQKKSIQQDIDVLIQIFKQKSLSYKHRNLLLIDQESNVFDESLQNLKTLLKEYAYQKSQSESFFKNLFGINESPPLQETVTKNIKIFKVRADIISLRNKLSQAKNNKIVYKQEGKQQQYLKLKDHLAQFTDSLYDQFRRMITNEQKSTLNNSGAESLHNSQVSQRSDFISHPNKPHLHHSNSVNTKSFSSSQAKQQLSKSQYLPTRSSLPNPHPKVMNILQKLPPLQYPLSLNLTSNLPNQGPFKYQLGTYYGNYKQGQRWGKGYFIFHDGSYYEGSWQNDNMSGYGRLITQKSTYEGYIKDGAACGYGVYQQMARNYKGFWENDQRHGEGEEQFIKPKAKYKGQYLNDRFHGQGQLDEQQFSYIGQFANGKYEGTGRIRYNNGQVFQGTFKEGNKVMGRHTMADGSFYEGNYEKNLPNGFGQFYWADGQKYRGYWRDGMQEGEGVQTFENGKQMKGYWKSGNWVKWVL